MISIVMAAYNGELYIQKQLQSIYEQTRKPDEVLIYDDCSKDHTVEIIQDFIKGKEDVTWKLLCNENNVGYIKNFLTAIEEAAGDIIILADQDDIWLPGKIARMEEIMNSVPGILSLHTEIDIIDKDDHILKHAVLGYQKQLEQISVSRFCQKLNYCGMSTAFRKEIKSYLNTLDRQELFTHDWTIHAIGVCKEGLYLSNEVLTQRRYHDSNVALNMDAAVRTGVKQRLGVIHEYLQAYQLLLKISSNTKIDQSKQKLIKKYIKTTNLRIQAIKNKSYIQMVKNMVHIRFFPNWKAYICDWLYLLGIF